MNRRYVALYVLFFFIVLYSLFSIGHYGGDGYQDYLTAESIVLDGNLSLYDRPDDPNEIDYIKPAGLKGKDGKIYSSVGTLGVPIILAVFYYVGHMLASLLPTVPHDYITMLFVSFSNPIICALNCMIIFLISQQLGFKPGTSVKLSLIYGLATMLPVYART